jgi:hypothetical protein
MGAQGCLTSKNGGWQYDWHAWPVVDRLRGTNDAALRLQKVGGGVVCVACMCVGGSFLLSSNLPVFLIWASTLTLGFRTGGATG